MERYYVIADDLTGANTVGVRLKQEGRKPCITFTGQINGGFSKKNYDTLIFNSESRNMNSEASGKVVGEIVKRIMEADKSPALIAKRIDSTLRGNIGSEIDAVLHGIASDCLAFVVPAFPEAGRTVLDGRMYVNQTLLEHSEAAQDPRKPVCCSLVKQIIEAQSHFKASNIKLPTIRQGKKSIQSAILQKSLDGNKILIFDGETQEDLKAIAEAVESFGEQFVTVDPGIFTQQIARIKKNQGKIMLLIGSVNSVTKKQVEKFKKEYRDCECILVYTKNLLKNGIIRKKEMDRVINLCLQAYQEKRIVLIVGDGIYPENRIDFSDKGVKEQVEDFSQRITEGMTEIAVKVLEKERRINSFFLSGGDIAISMLHKNKAKGFIPLTEVLPLAVCGTVMGGRIENCRIITKGGMVGNEDAIIDCVKYLNDESF